MACSRQFIVIISGDLVFRYFRVLFPIAGCHYAWHQNLSSGQNSRHPVRHASPGTVQSFSVGITCLISVYHWKDVGYDAMLERKFVSSGFSDGKLFL